MHALRVLPHEDSKGPLHYAEGRFRAIAAGGTCLDGSDDS